MSIRNALLALTLGLCVSGGVLADTLALKKDHPTRYVVVKGDTLWDISSKFLRDPWRWPEIWYINPEIRNPHLIYPGDIITLVYVDGKPVLQVQRGGNGSGLPAVKLSPQARATHLDSAIPTVPATAISQFLFQPRILSEEQVEQAGYITAAEEERLISGSGNKIYVLNLTDDTTKDFSVYRINQVYRDPDDDDEILGYEAIHVSQASMIRAGEPATLEITESFRETLLGDKVLAPDEEEVSQSFIPQAPDNKVKGKIISFIDGMSRAGQYQTVVLNLGQRDGLENGHVLAAWTPGETVVDKFSDSFFKKKVQLPDERAAILMVVRAFDRVSYAMVMSATSDISIGNPVTNP